MKTFLPQYHIELNEIPRIQNQEKSISASYVRRELEKGRVENALELVPFSTRKMIMEQL